MPRCVPALQQLCRMTIRKQILSTKVDHLHLPVRLKEFLKYHDLWLTRDSPQNFNFTRTAFDGTYIWKSLNNKSKCGILLACMNLYEISSNLRRGFFLFTICILLFLKASLSIFMWLFFLAYVFIIWKNVIDYYKNLTRNSKVILIVSSLHLYTCKSWYLVEDKIFSNS